MDKRFTIKDFFLFTAIGGVLVALLVAMYMIDRQWNMMSRMRATMQEQAEDLRALRAGLKALDERVASGIVTAYTTAPEPEPAVAAAFERGARRDEAPRLRVRRLARPGLRRGAQDHHPARVPGRLRLRRAGLRAGDPDRAQPRHPGMGGAHRTLVGHQRGRPDHHLPAARRGDLLRRPAAHRRRCRVHLRLHHERGDRGAALSRLPREDRVGGSDLHARGPLPVPRALLQRACARGRTRSDAAALLRALPRRPHDLQRVQGTAARLRTLPPRGPQGMDPGPRPRRARTQSPLLGTGRAELRAHPLEGNRERQRSPHHLPQPRHRLLRRPPPRVPGAARR